MPDAELTLEERKENAIEIIRSLSKTERLVTYLLDLVEINLEAVEELLGASSEVLLADLESSLLEHDAAKTYIEG